jgi:hypothetical protein
VRRTIRQATRRSRSETRELLQMLFVTELIAPSQILWITSPWISDIGVIDNRASGFDFGTDWGPMEVPLSKVLSEIARRGGRVVVITTKDPSNDHFLRRLDDEKAAAGVSDAIRVVFDDDERLHEKAIVGDGFVVDGSMNLTFHGVYIRRERVNYSTDPAEVAQARVDMHHDFGGLE